MNSPSSRAKLYAFGFLDELGPIYALYSVWFLDVGISPAELSVVFAMWAAITIALEVPSGAVADLVDKRLVVAFALVLRGLGIALWFTFPTPTMMYVGAALWSVHSALASGAWETLIYEQMERDGTADDFPSVLARVDQFSHVGVALGTIGGSALVYLGTGIPVLGWITVAIHFAALPLLFWLPRVEPANHLPEGPSSWWATIREGAGAVAGNRLLAPLVGIAVVLEALFIFDDYVPALARIRGASDETIPIFVLVVWIGLILGGEFAARRPGTRRGALAIALVIGGFATVAAFSVGSSLALTLVAVGYAMMNTVWVITEARLISTAPAAQRATVRSFVGLFGGVLHIGIFGVVGLLTLQGDPSFGLVAVAVALPLLALFVAKYLPDQT